MQNHACNDPSQYNVSFLGLCTGDCCFAADDPEPRDHLPVDDKAWVENVGHPFSLDFHILTLLSLLSFAELSLQPTLLTPSDTTVGTFAREAQINHITGRTLFHVFAPTYDIEFHKSEFLQLERTMMTYMPFLMEEERKWGNYCAALGICSRYVTHVTTILIWVWNIRKCDSL